MVVVADVSVGLVDNVAQGGFGRDAAEAKGDGVVLESAGGVLDDEVWPYLVLGFPRDLGFEHVDGFLNGDFVEVDLRNDDFANGVFTFFDFPAVAIVLDADELASCLRVVRVDSEHFAETGDGESEVAFIDSDDSHLVEVACLLCLFFGIGVDVRGHGGGEDGKRQRHNGACGSIFHFWIVVGCDATSHVVSVES